MNDAPELLSVIQKEIHGSSLEFIKNYLTGALHDGTLTTSYQVKYFQEHKPWITSVIKPCLEKAYNTTFGPKAIYWDQTKWVLHFKRQDIWKDLHSRSQKELQHLTKDATILYIRGFWDADGGCPHHPSLYRKLYIDLTQKDATHLSFVKDWLNRHGITTGEIRISERKPTGNIHRFAITGKNAMLAFIETIGSWHPEKRHRLLQIKNLIKAER